MPVMNVNYRAGDLGDAAKADLAKRLTDVLIRMEGGANTHAGRAFAWVLFHELPAADWWIGGEPGEGFIYPPGRFLVHVTIPEGYMNQAHKSEVHAWVNDAILAATGTPKGVDVGESILVVIDEVPEGNWGWAGNTISIENIATSVGLAKSSERYAWVESYFAAKARMLDAYSYPRDMGGVLPAISRDKPAIPAAASA